MAASAWGGGQDAWVVIVALGGRKWGCLGGSFRFGR